MFSFARLVGVDPMLGVEMASTGEVGCLGEGLHEALLHGLLATGFRFPRKGVLLSLGRPDGYLIRRRAVDAGVPLITDLQLARAVVEALRLKIPHAFNVRPWNDYVKSQSPA